MTGFVKSSGIPERPKISPPFGIGEENPPRDPNLVAETKKLLDSGTDVAGEERWVVGGHGPDSVGPEYERSEESDGISTIGHCKVLPNKFAGHISKTTRPKT